MGNTQQILKKSKLETAQDQAVQILGTCPK